MSPQTENTGRLDVKAIRLQELKTAGYNVPDFVVLNTATVQNLDLEISNSNLLNTVVTKVKNTLTTKLFAVRSAALAEDGKIIPKLVNLRLCSRYRN